MTISISLSLQAAYYTFFLIARKSHLKNSLFREGLIALIVILILYIYGEQDRFWINDNSIEDLADFGFILVLVVLFWSIVSFVFGLFKYNLNHLNKPTFLIFRGIVLLALIIPLDFLFNVSYLNIAYSLPLYEDYWVLEIPLKISLILLINFLDQVHLFSEKEEKNSSQLEVKIGNQRRFIEPGSIAYFKVQNQTCYLYTTDGEKLMVDQPLNQLEKRLNNDFFKAGRQLLVSRKAINGYKSIQGKKIELSLSIQGESSDKYLISRLNAPDFRRWIKSH